MKKTVPIVIVVLITLAMVSCATISMPVAATGVSLGSKVGVASGKTIFGVFGKDTNSTIAQAAKNGGITQISTVDFSFNPGFLYIVQTYTCTVTGE